MDHEEGMQLRKILNKVDDMRLQRCQLIKSLEIDLENDDITKKVLTIREFNLKVFVFVFWLFVYFFNNYFFSNYLIKNWKSIKIRLT